MLELELTTFSRAKTLKTGRTGFCLETGKSCSNGLHNPYIYKQRCESCRFLHSPNRRRKPDSRTKVSKMLENLPGRIKFFSSASHGGHDPSECVGQTTRDSDFALRSTFIIGWALGLLHKLPSWWSSVAPSSFSSPPEHKHPERTKLLLKKSRGDADQGGQNVVQAYWDFWYCKLQWWWDIHCHVIIVTIKWCTPEGSIRCPCLLGLFPIKIGIWSWFW